MNDREAENFLDKNIKVIIEPMIGDILEERPDDSVRLVLLKFTFFLTFTDFIYDSMVTKAFRKK